jgi:hypothetical protein
MFRTLFRKYYDFSSIASGIGSVAGVAGGPVGLAISTGLQAAIGIGQMIKSGKLNSQADNMESGLTRPEYVIQQGIRDNQALAEYRAQQGLSDAAMSVYATQQNRGLTTSTDAILRGGGNVSNIADLYGTADEDYAKVALLEEEARLKGQSILMDTNKATAAEEDKAWQLNVYNPYMDKVSAIDRLRARAQQTSDAGRNAAVGAVGNFVTGNLLRNQIGNGSGDVETARLTAPLLSFNNPAPSLDVSAPTSLPYANPSRNVNLSTPAQPQYGDYFKMMFSPTNIKIPYSR